MSKYTWDLDRAECYIKVVKIVYKNEKKNKIKFKGIIAYRRGEHKDYVLEKKTYTMNLDLFRKLKVDE